MYYQNGMYIVKIINFLLKECESACLTPPPHQFIETRAVNMHQNIRALNSEKYRRLKEIPKSYEIASTQLWKV